MGQSFLSLVGLFFFIASIPAFFLPGAWWWLSVGFILLAIMIAGIKATWEIADFGQKQVEKLNCD